MTKPTTSPPPPPPRRQASEYAERDRAILRFTWRLQAVVAAAVSARFLEGKQSGHVLRRFEARGWLSLESAAIPGGVSYATLTASGGKEIGKIVKPRPMSGTRLDVALAVGGYCFLEENPHWRRRRLAPEEIHGLGGDFAANVPHVLTNEFGNPVVLRVQQAATGKPQVVLAKALETFDTVVSAPKGEAWVRSLAYGIVLLGHTTQRVRQLQEAVKRDRRFQGKRLVVGLGPTSETLAAVLRERRKR